MSTTATRDALLGATRAAINEGGLESVTAREVAGRAQANLASIGYHFGSKDALVAEALVAEVTDLVAPVLELLDGADDAVGRAASAVTVLGDLFETSITRIPAYLAALSHAPHDGEVRRRLAGLFEQVRERLAQNIEGQLEAGDLPGWVDPSAMAALIVAVVQGVVVAAAVEPDRAEADARALAGQLVGLLLAVRTNQ
ncbi:MAG: TetR/AcrR family transcriptional regulator [Microthrixaceae bacterium]